MKGKGEGKLLLFYKWAIMEDQPLLVCSFTLIGVLAMMLVACHTGMSLQLHPIKTVPHLFASFSQAC